MKRKLKKEFFKRDTLKVAQELLGKYIVRKYKNKILAGKIIETEAYIGPKDKASHAFCPKEKRKPISLKTVEKFFGKKFLEDKEFLKNILKYAGKITSRNKIEYFEGGYIYIYLVYGMYWQLNISTSQAGRPECVLIRALDKKEARGPGKLCQFLKLDKSFYGKDITNNKKIWIEDRGEKINSSKIIKTKRIGIDYAGPFWAKRKWRFLLKEV